MISAYAISGKVWVVRTDTVAEDEVPATLPIGSVVLTAQEAAELGRQLIGAGAAVIRRERKAAARG